jgi:hypothetical protein
MRSYQPGETIEIQTAPGAWESATFIRTQTRYGRTMLLVQAEDGTTFFAHPDKVR